MSYHITNFPGYVKLALILLSIAIIIALLFIGQHIIIPLLLSLLFAILLMPLFTFFNTKCKFPHVIAALVSVVLFVVVIGGIIFFISWKTSDITEDWNKIKFNLSVHYEHIQHWIKQEYNVSYNKQQNYIDQVKKQTLNGNSQLMGNTLSSFTGTLLNIVLIPIYTFLILLYRELFINFLYKIVKEKNETTLTKVLSQVKTVVQRYILGLFIEMGIVAVLTTTGLMLLGIQYAILLGVITAVLNLIPYIGILMAGLIAVLATLGNSTDVSLIIGIIVLNSVVQLIDNNIVVPKIVGNNVRINALVTMSGVIIGGAAWGIPGMVLSIPLIAIIKVIFDHVEPFKPWGYVLGNTEPTSLKSMLKKQHN